MAVVDVGTGRVTDVATGSPDVPVVAFTAAADGSALYLVRDRSRSDVWLLRLR